MVRALCFRAMLALPLAGCSLSGVGVSPSGLAVNQCKVDADCPGARCQDGLCLGSGGSLTSLLVTVTPPSTLSNVTSLTYYQTYAVYDSAPSNQLPPGGGGLDIELDQGLDVSGPVRIDPTNCSPIWSTPTGTEQTSPNGGIPADVTFTPSEHVVGVPVDNYAASLQTVNTAKTDDWYVFHQTLPPGDYDVYVAPHLELDPSSAVDSKCHVPPRLILNQNVSKTTFTVNLPASSTLDVDVTWPLTEAYSDALAQADPSFADPLAGWTLDLVDPNTGRVLSYEEPVTALKMAPVNPDESVTYKVTLVYAPVYAPGKNGALEPLDIGSDVLRLKPPAYDPRTCPDQACPDQAPYTAPTILAQLDGALVDADGKPAPAQIVQPTLLPAPVHVEFQTALASDGTPVPASVFLRATSLDGVTGLVTSFSRSVDVGTDGVGEVDLLPGHYHVTASAKSGCTIGSCLGNVIGDWVVAQAPASQAGKLLEFSPPATFSGTALVYGGRPASGASVDLVASSLVIDSNVLNVGDGSAPAVAQSSSGLVGEDGTFTFQADPGTFDLRVRPDPSTGYGWFVQPHLTLPDQAPYDDVGELDLDLPISYRGSISALTSNGLVMVPRALIRAYAYMNADGTVSSKSDAAFAVQVAETYSDDTSGDPGAFQLLIPPAFATP